MPRGPTEIRLSLLSERMIIKYPADDTIPQYKYTSANELMLYSYLVNDNFVNRP